MKHLLFITACVLCLNTTSEIQKNTSFKLKEDNLTMSSNMMNEAAENNPLIGTWKFGSEYIGYMYWTFKTDGTYSFEDKMNDGGKKEGKYSVSGNILTVYGPGDQCGDVSGTYPFEINEGELEFGNINDKCRSRASVFNHIWEK